MYTQHELVGCRTWVKVAMLPVVSIDLEVLIVTHQGYIPENTVYQRLLI